MFTKINPHRYISFIDSETKEHLGSLHVKLNEVIHLLPKDKFTTKKSLVGDKVYIKKEDLDIFLKEYYLNNGEIK